MNLHKRLYCSWHQSKHIINSCTSFISQRRIYCQQVDAERKRVISLLGDGINYQRARHYRMIFKKKISKPNPKFATDDSYVTKLPVSLKYFVDNDDENQLMKETDQEVQAEDSEDDIQVHSYPYEQSSKLLSRTSVEDNHSHKNILQINEQILDYVKNYLKIINIRDYDFKKYNVSRPDIPSSQVPCSGCGAYLHCKDSSIPGFMPSMKFLSLSTNELRKEICYRCFFLKKYNTAMNINIPPEEYPKAIAEIKNKVALVILMVDLIDFPCSIWPGIINLIGEKRPICVVGNKVDLLPQDSSNFLEGVKNSLSQNLIDFGVDKGNNIKHIALISAKTGFGVESLINKVQKYWKFKGDIYLIGCTNVGKSTLFNILLQSDLCKNQASDIVPPTTTSVWPGTTVSLLKFPLNIMSRYDLYLRANRLMQQRTEEAAERKFHLMEFKSSKVQENATLFGHVKKSSNSEQSESLKPSIYDPDNPEFKFGKFLYDTPGSVYKEQILDILTTDELVQVLPRKIIVPRTFIIRENQTLFLGGLAKIDLIKGGKNIFMTVFASDKIPVHLVDTEDAELFYEQNIGTKLLAVPFGNEKRMNAFPKLEGKQLKTIAKSFRKSCADIVLSTAGWVSLSADIGEDIELKAYTPNGRGIHLRTPALLPFAVNLRGKRLKGVPAFENKMASIGK